MSFVAQIDLSQLSQPMKGAEDIVFPYIKEAGVIVNKALYGFKKKSETAWWRQVTRNSKDTQDLLKNAALPVAETLLRSIHGSR